MGLKLRVVYLLGLKVFVTEACGGSVRTEPLDWLVLGGKTVIVI